LLVAAIAGDQLNYTIGRYIGPKVFQWEDSRWFNRKAFNAAHSFLRKAWRHHHHPGAFHAVHPHLCARLWPEWLEMNRARPSPPTTSVGAADLGGGPDHWRVTWFGNLPFRAAAILSKIIWALILIPGA
jgi:membrane-associated protein